MLKDMMDGTLQGDWAYLDVKHNRVNKGGGPKLKTLGLSTYHPLLVGKS